MLHDRNGKISLNGNPMCIRERFGTMWKQTLRKDDILFEDYATTFRVIDVRRFKLCDIEPLRELITFDEVPPYYGQCYCMTVEVDLHHNKKLGSWKTDVIYVSAENTAFAKKILLQNHINLSHIVLMRYGGGFGGSKGSYGKWLFGLAGPLNVQYYITDKRNASRKLTEADKTALKYLRDGSDLDVDEYGLTPIYEREWYNDEPAVWRKVEKNERNL